MDDGDRAQRYAEQELDRALKNIPQRPRLPYTGTCHWCSAPVGPHQRFCDRFCADDHEMDIRRKEQRARA